MGRDPWIRLQQTYLGTMRSYYSPRTLEVMERGFRSIRGAFRILDEAYDSAHVGMRSRSAD